MVPDGRRWHQSITDDDRGRAKATHYDIVPRYTFDFLSVERTTPEPCTISTKHKLFRRSSAT